MNKIEIVELLVKILLIPLATWGVQALVSYLKANTKSRKFDKYYALANDAVIKAVKETMQTFVSGLKSAGEWTDETAKEAFNKAMDTALVIMGKTVRDTLPEIVGDAEKWLTASIEAATLSEKEKAKS